MNSGMSLVALAQELERQVETRQDFVTPASRVELTVAGSGAVQLQGLPTGPLDITTNAHQQIREYTGVPAKYYDRMLTEAPELLASNVNTWLGREYSAKRLVRTLDGKARAFLSNRYRPLDNYDLATAVLPTLRDSGAVVRSASITETRLYIKATLPSLSREVRGSVRRGDIVEAGISISNSEVGKGALSVDPFFLFLVCLNGAVRESAFRRYHVGKAIDVDAAYEVFTDNTRKLDDAAFFSKVTDVVKASFDIEIFEAEMLKFESATQQRIEGDPAKAIDAVIERLALPPATRPGVLRNLIEGGDLSRFGVMNAVTALANDETDYEVSTLLERAGGKVIELSDKDWSVVAQAA